LQIAGVGKDSMWQLWRVVQGTGLYRLHRGASADAHRAASYRVSLDFGVWSEHPLELDCLATALNHLLRPEQIQRLYSRHYARVIHAAPSPRLIPSDGQELAFTAVQQLLRRSSGAPIRSARAA
jgi:hypothetical protein